MSVKKASTAEKNALKKLDKNAKKRDSILKDLERSQDPRNFVTPVAKRFKSEPKSNPAASPTLKERMWRDKDGSRPLYPPATMHPAGLSVTEPINLVSSSDTDGEETEKRD